MAKNGKPKHRKRPLRGGASPTSQRRLRAAQRQRQALDLRMGGASFDQIAESLGYANRGGAHKAVMAGLATPVELAEGVRELELKRLDRLWLTVWEPAIRGDREAIAICIQLMKRRADFEGLDKAKKHEHSGPDGKPLPVAANAQVRIYIPHDGRNPIPTELAGAAPPDRSPAGAGSTDRTPAGAPGTVPA